MRSLAALLLVTGLSAGGIAACSGSDIDDLGLGKPNPDKPPIEEQAKPVIPAAGGLRRLKSRQYVTSIRAVFGDVAAVAAAPPPDSALHGLDAIGAAELALPEAAIEAYETSARDIADAVVSDAATLDQLLPCAPAGFADAECHRQFITEVGRVAWRRPLLVEEVDLLVNVAQAAAAQYQSFNAGLEYAISGLLQSPYFLYMVEVGEPDPTEENPAQRRLTAYELGSRMSFFLLDRTPDRSMLDRVEKGGLDTDEAIRDTARQMLEKPEARAALANFYTEIFKLRDIETISKDTILFPQWSAALAQAMKQETLELINDIVWEQNGDARDMFTAEHAFVNAELATLYGVPPPTAGFGKVTLPASQARSGMLGSAGFLARFSHPSTTSPTRRGHFIKEILLCEEVPPPPPGVAAEFPPDDPTKPKTAKMKLEAHMNKDECKSCHQVMDPFGFALENYDALGVFRTTDQGFTIDPSATVDGVGTFASARELGAILRDDPRGAACIIRNLFRNSMGHLETKGELPALAALEKAFDESGFRIQDLLVELVASPAFQLVGEPK
jgi:hypothetical protein